MVYLQQWAGEVEGQATLSKFMVDYIYKQRDNFHFVVQRPGESYEHQGNE